MANLYFWTITGAITKNLIYIRTPLGFGALFGMRNQRFLFFTDNQSQVSVINKQTSKDAELISFVRTMVLVCLQNNILFKAKHVAGRRNVLADHLSHFQVDQFLQLAPVHMHRFPTSIPSHLLPAKLATIVSDSLYINNFHKLGIIGLI